MAYRLFILHNINLEKISKISRNKNLILLFEYIEKNPIIEVQKTSNELKLTYNTINKSVLLFIQLGILEETKKVGRTRVFSYKKYLEILRKDTF